MAFDLNNPKDREFLKNRINKKTGLSLLDEQIQHEKQLLLKNIKPAEIIAKDKKPGKAKYGNISFEKQGIKWQSEYEYHCYLQLKELEKSGFIKNLKLQVVYKFEYNNIRIAKYIADFVFEYNNKIIVADAKHKETTKQLKWIWQKKMMLAFYEKNILIFYKNETEIRQAIMDFKEYEKITK